MFGQEDQGIQQVFRDFRSENNDTFPTTENTNESIRVAPWIMMNRRTCSSIPKTERPTPDLGAQNSLDLYFKKVKIELSVKEKPKMKKKNKK